MNKPTPNNDGRRDYTAPEIEAARRVLAELMDILEEYHHGIVLVGGWVPYFAIPNPKVPHEGTKDIDLALDAESLKLDGDQTIEEILHCNLYQQDIREPFRWYRGVDIDGKFIQVVVDFLTSEREGYVTGCLQKIQDIHVTTMEGFKSAFLNPIEVSLDSKKPDGSSVNTTFQMASVPQYLALKGLALHNRDNMGSNYQGDARKDAHDIYFMVKYYPDGIEALAEAIKPFLDESRMSESLSKIADKWKTIGDRGPALVAKHEDDDEERHRLQRDAYEQVRKLLVQLEIVAS